ncbi:MAG TPA: hypothetical protein VFB34_04540 [Chloroflexota bacterium]|nr:hypothetical protein [Chloroflexota bacterium]
MNRTTLFGLAVIAGIVFIVLVVLAWTGAAPFGHHKDGPMGIQNFKHGILFVVLAIVCFVFAAATRPTSRAS